MKLTIETRIHMNAHVKTLARITRRKRSRTGFRVVQPDGKTSQHRTRTEALQAMYAQIRCAPQVTWKLEIVPPAA